MGVPYRLPKQYDNRFSIVGGKPLDNFDIDYSWTYANNISMLAMPDKYGVRDLVSGQYFQPTSPTAFNVVYDQIHGQGIGTPTNDTAEIILGSQFGSGGSTERWSAPSDEVTLICVMKRNGAAAGNAPIFGATTATNSPFTPWNFIDRTGNGTLQFESAINGTYGALELPNGISDNEMHVLVGTYDGTRTRLYIDGVERLTDIRSGSLTYPSQCRPVMCNFWDFDAQPRSFNGYVFLGMVLDKAMQPEEVPEFSRTLYGAFLRSTKTSPLYFVEGEAPGNIINAVISYGTNLSSNYDNFIQAQASISELARLISNQASQVDFTSSLSENSVYSDTNISALIANESVSENTIQTDSLQSQIVILASIGESVDAGFTSNVQREANASVSDSVSVNDALNSVAVFNEAVSEAIDAGYITSTGSIVLANVSEAVNSGSTYTSTISLEVAISEAISAGDVNTATADLLAAISELSELGDTEVATRITDSSITENSNLTATFQSGLTIQAGTLESVGLASTETSSISIEAMLSEGLNVSDDLLLNANLNVDVTENTDLNVSLLKTALLEAGLQEATIQRMTTVGSVVALELQLPRNRTLVVTMENRCLTVTAENRTLTL